MRGERRRREECGGSPSEEKILFSLSTPITTILFRSAARACEEKRTTARCLHAMHVYTEVSLSGRHSGPPLASVHGNENRASKY